MGEDKWPWSYKKGRVGKEPGDTRKRIMRPEQALNYLLPCTTR
jgi:hypothetical protein